MQIKVGKTASELRNRLGLTQREVAEALGITVVHLSNIENNKSPPSHGLIDEYRRLWGVDLYVLAWCTHGNLESLPLPLRSAAKKLGEALQRQLPSDFRPRGASVNG